MPKPRFCLLSILCLALFLPELTQAQSFQAGLRSYDQRDFERAAAIFSELNSPQAALFTAKSYYALHRFNEAEGILNDLLEESLPRIYYEAAYTSSLVDFQQKQYAFALTKLYNVFKNANDERLAADSQELYKQILNYLTAEQRLKAIELLSSAQIKYQVVESARGRVSFGTVKKLINRFYDSTDEEVWLQQMEQLESSITSEAAYKVEYGDSFNSFPPPDGTLYNIGIALPKFNTGEPTFGVVRGLFLGARLATEQFNDTHSNAKAYLTFLPTGSNDLEGIVERFVNRNYGDLIIGPLFSEHAEEMASLSAGFNIPAIAPLATSEISSSGSLFYQANSTFAVHGEMMARFAVNELGMNTFAVIAGQGTNGEKSAASFRETAEALGAEVVSFQIKDFEAANYDISVDIKQIGSELTTIGAVYAPFTSNYTPYLIEQLIYSTNRLTEPITLLGSQKWGEMDFANDIYSRSDIYFTTNSYRSGNISDFQYRYRQAFNVRPSKFATIGYDVMRYVLQILDKAGNPAVLNEAIQKSAFYRGLMKNIWFNGTHVNQAVHILKVGSGGSPVLQKWR